MKKCSKVAVATFVVGIVLSFVVYMILFDSTGVPAGFEEIEFESSILGETRECIISLPNGYDPNDSEGYAVLYVIGGNTLTFLAAENRDLLQLVEIVPQMIVVGVPNVDQSTRQRDLTPPFLRQDIDELDSPKGKADVYLDFLEQEVVKKIEADYNTSGFRMLAGHSREGLCVTYSLMKKPDLFDARFAFSPAYWREENRFVSEFESYLKDDLKEVTFLYISLGSEENEKMTQAFQQAENVILESALTNLVFKSEYVEGANHGNNHKKSMPLALKWLFEQAC